MNLLMNDETVALACLRQIGLTPMTLSRLYRHFGSLRSVWEERSFAGLELQEKDLEALRGRSQALWEKLSKLVSVSEVQFFHKDDEMYPILLKEISSCPPFLFVRGNLQALQAQVPVAIVGTRNMSSYGQQVLHEIIPPLVRAGVTIVSGLAYGIDALAHEIALEHGGTCVAVFGSGIDVIYPREHRSLTQRILLNGGTLVSEQGLGVSPQAHFFPARNRIISGLSKATVVVEAKKKSGSLITAKFALEQNREVFAVPGSIFEATQEGTNHLISQGAYPLTEAADLLDQLHLSKENIETPQAQLSFESPEEQALYSLLKKPHDLDEICQQSDIPSITINRCLSALELKGYVRVLQGREYVRC